MKCPHCGLGVHLEEDDTLIVYPHGDPDKAETGVELAHGACPQCYEMIAIAREGKFKSPGTQDHNFVEILSEEIIYPKGVIPKVLDSSIPEFYRNDYHEAYLIQELSPKASAAICRR